MKAAPKQQGKTVLDASNPVYTIGLVHKHLEDPSHVITDEELRNVRITTEHINVSEHPIVKSFH